MLSLNNCPVNYTKQTLVEQDQWDNNISPATFNISIKMERKKKTSVHIWYLTLPSLKCFVSIPINNNQWSYSTAQRQHLILDNHLVWFQNELMYTVIKYINLNAASLNITQRKVKKVDFTAYNLFFKQKKQWFSVLLLEYSTHPSPQILLCNTYSFSIHWLTVQILLILFH